MSVKSEDLASESTPYQGLLPQRDVVGLVVKGNCSVHGDGVDCFVIAVRDVECCECFTPAKETA